MAKYKLIVRNNAKLSNGSFPIALRLAHMSQQATHIRLKGMSVKNLNEWNADLGRFTQKKTNYRVLNNELSNVEEKAETILELLMSTNSFSYSNFKAKFNNENTISDSVFDAYNKRIEELKQSNKQSGTADFYEDSMNALKEIVGTRNIVFNDIDYSFLKEYERKRRNKGNSGTTIAIYLRGLRAIHYDYCKTTGKPQPSCYRTFNINRMVEPTRRRALTRDQLKALIDYKPVSRFEQRAKDYFLFSFYCSGINLMDISKLKCENVIGGRIEYRRSKTGGLFSVNISEPMQEIIDKYSNSGKYLFPIVNSKDTIRDDATAMNSSVNKNLKRIAKKINIPSEISFYWARHSFANQARQAGFNIDIISAVLGHSSVEVTKSYLSCFNNESIDAVSTSILNSL